MKIKRIKRTRTISIRVDEKEIDQLIDKANKFARGNVSELIRIALNKFNG